MAFYAYLSSTTELTDDSIVIFDSIVTNIGDAYSDISGTFTGKHCSLYLLSYVQNYFQSIIFSLVTGFVLVK